MKNMILKLCTFSVLICIVAANGSANGGGVGQILLSNENCSGASCYCDITGNVTDVISGDIMDVADLGEVKLIGIISPDISKQEGKRAKLYLESLTLNKFVCLKKYDVETPHLGTILAVAYLIDPDDTVNTSKSINQLILDVDGVHMDPETSSYVINDIWDLPTNVTV